MRYALAGLAALSLLVLVACAKPTKEELLRKAEGIKTRTELQQKMGTPDDVAKFGPLERWIYKGSNGSVVFLITGENVALGATSDKQ